MHAQGDQELTGLLHLASSTVMKVLIFALTPSMQCSDLHNLDFNVSRCNYVNCVESCKSESDFNYLKFIYCVLPSKLVPLGMIILVSLSVKFNPPCMATTFRRILGLSWDGPLEGGE